MDRVRLIIANEWRAYWRRFSRAGLRSNQGILLLVGGVDCHQVCASVARRGSESCKRQLETATATLASNLPGLALSSRSQSSRHAGLSQMDAPPTFARRAFHRQGHLATHSTFSLDGYRRLAGDSSIRWPTLKTLAPAYSQVCCSSLTAWLDGSQHCSFAQQRSVAKTTLDRSHCNFDRGWRLRDQRRAS